MISRFLIAICVMAAVLSKAQPVAPNGFSASGLSTTSVLLTWNDQSADETGFQIERSSSASGPFSWLATTTSNSISFVSSGLVSGAQYFYRIRAINGAGSSNYSPVLAVTTGIRRFLIDFGSTSFLSTGTGWNNITAPTTGSISNLVEANGIASSVNLQIVNDPSDGYAASTTAGYKATLLDYPMTACQDGHFGYATGGTYRINGLNNTMSYNLRFFGSRIGVTDSRKSVFTIQGQSLTLETAGNTSQTVLFTNIVPINGSITIDFMVGAGSDFAYINVLDVVEYQSTPSTPTTLQAQPGSATQINLNWQDASGNESGFQLERSLTAGAGYAQIATVGANVTSYVDHALAPVTPYFYRVRAVNALGVSGYSNEATTTTLATPPNAPSLLTATPTNQEINLSWVDGSDNETGFQLERSFMSGTGFSLLTTLPANATSFLDNGLNGDTQYFYRLRAINSGGGSAYSNEVNAITWPAPPIAPSALSATAISATEIALTWLDLATNEQSFELELSMGLSSAFSLLTTLQANTLQYVVAGLNPSTTYRFRLRAINSAGPSAYSAEVSTATLPWPPMAPTSLAATAVSANQINLSWVDLSDNETGFYVERSLQPETGFAPMATLTANESEYQDYNLNPETRYYYRIRAFNAGGNSSFTAVANAMTWAAPPQPPTGLSAVAVSTAQINLSWTDASTNETGFQVERSITPGSGYTTIATTGANVTSFSDVGLSLATTYFYRIRAINATGSSAYTHEVTATTFSLIQPYGEIFSETSFTSSTRFPIVGSGITRGTNKLVLTGAPGYFKSYVYHDDPASPFRYTCLENWTMRVRVKTPTAFNTTSFGITLGVLSSNTYNPYSTLLRWSWTPGNFKVHMYHKTTTSKQIVSTTSYTPTPNTFYWIQVTRNKDSFTYSVFDGTTGTTSLYSVTLTFPTFTPATYVNAHNTGRFCIQQFGGNNTEITHWQVSTSAIKNTDFIGVGDSNMHGMFAANNSQRWVESAMTTANRSFGILAGTADRTVDVLQRLPEIIALKPKAVVLSIGRNDLVNAIPLATVQTNVTTIINTLEAAGITVYLAGVIASNTNVSNVQAFYNTRNNIKVNGFIATKSATANSLAAAYNSGDNIHLNAAGNTWMSNLLLPIVNAPILVSPTGLSASSNVPSQINLGWTDNSITETGFLIERSLTPSTDFVSVATVGSNVTQFQDADVLAGTVYYYRVKAITSAGNSGYTNEASIQLGGNPSARSANAGSTEVTEGKSLTLEPQLEVYPNPANSKIWLRVVSNQPEPVVVVLFDVMGRPLMQQNGSSLTELSFDLSGLASGVFIVKAQLGGQVLSKIVKKEP